MILINSFLFYSNYILRAMVEKCDSNEWFKNEGMPWWGVFAKYFFQVFFLKLLLLCFKVF